MSKGKEIRERAHHSILIALDVRKQVVCPMCGSKEYYKNVQYSQCVIEYTDGYEKEDTPMEYEWQNYQCGDCEYETDY